MFKDINKFITILLNYMTYFIFQKMIIITEVGFEEKIPVLLDNKNLLFCQLLELYFHGALGLYFKKLMQKKFSFPNNVHFFKITFGNT